MHGIGAVIGAEIDRSVGVDTRTAATAPDGKPFPREAPHVRPHQGAFGTRGAPCLADNALLALPLARHEAPSLSQGECAWPAAEAPSHGGRTRFRQVESQSLVSRSERFNAGCSWSVTAMRPCQVRHAIPTGRDRITGLNTIHHSPASGSVLWGGPSCPRLEKDPCFGTFAS